MVKKKSRIGQRHKRNGTNTITASRQSVDEQTSSEAAEPSVVRESISAKTDESVLEGNLSSSRALLTSQRRSTRRIVDATYQCKICQLRFSTEYKLRQHVDYYGDPKYLCKECGTKFTDRRQLQSHITNAHGRLNPKFTAKCIICKQMFALQAHLQAHLCHYHEDWNKFIKTEKDIVQCLTKVEVEEDSSENYANCAEDPNDSTETQGLSTLETYLQTQQSAAIDNASPTKTVEIATTSVASVLQSHLEAKENGSDKRLGKEVQAISTNGGNADLQNGLHSKCVIVNPRRKDEHPKSANIENNHKVNDNATKSDQIMRESKQVLCLNEENRQVLESRLEDKSVVIIKGDEQIVRVKREKKYNFRSRFQDSEDKIDKETRESQDKVPLNEKNKRPQTDLKLLSSRAVSEQVEALLSNKATDASEEVLEIKALKGGYHFTKIGNSNCIRTTAEICENTSSLVAESSEVEIVATSIDSQEKVSKNDANKSLNEVRYYEKEMELRRLFSCKDCYVPLIRLEFPKTSVETAEVPSHLTRLHAEQKHNVIPSIVCDKMFKSKSMMYQHYQQYHLSYLSNGIRCVCGKLMKGYNALQYHFFRYCHKSISPPTMPTTSNRPCKPSEKKFLCPGCGEGFWLGSCRRSHTKGCKPFSKKKRKNSKEHVCRICDSTFVSEKVLLKHEKMYSRKRTNRCMFCGSTFFAERELNCHIESAHDLNSKAGYNFVCTICNQRFYRKRFERMHRMHIHQGEGFLENIREPSTYNISPPDSDDPGDDETTTNKCKVCNIVFTNKKRFIDHTIYYMKNEIIQCKTCGEKFEGQYRAHQHNKTVHYSKDTRMAFTHHCNVCKEGFMYMTHLQAHMFHVHSSEASAAICVNQNDGDESESQRKSNRSLDSLLYELRDRDDRTVPNEQYACDICDVRFPTPTHLAMHEVNFAPDGEYLCNRCSKKCRTPALLLDHLTLNHSNNAMQGGVKCRRCKENFLTHTDWVSHVKHFHNVEEPSEFYLEKNVASTEESGDIIYELIPTNESISSGRTRSRVKNSLDFSNSLATTHQNEKADERHFDANIRKIVPFVPEEGELITQSYEITEKTSINLKHRTKVKNPEDEKVTIHDFIKKVKNESLVNTSTIDLVPDKQPTINDNEEAMDMNLDFDTGQINEKSTDNKKSLTVLRKLRDDPEDVGEGHWKCNTCGYAFRSSSDLASHISLYSNCGHHMCEICGRRFELYELYREHVFSHTVSGNREYFCSNCNEHFKTSELMKMHLTHIHPESPTEFSTNARNIDPASESRKLPKSIRLRRTNERMQRCPEPNFYHHCKPGFVELPDSQVVGTYSLKQRNQPATMRTQEDTTNSEDFESPHLHTEIFEDEMSMIYECPTCQEKYSTVNRLDEHLMAVHNLKEDKKTFKKPLNGFDVALTCNICKKVFTDKIFLSIHRKKFHLTKSGRLKRNSKPVIKRNSPNIRLTNSNADKPITNSRLRNVDKIDIISKPVNCQKNNVAKKFTVFESPHLHTEIFEDEMSMIYECPTCHEKYSTVNRLDEHLMAVHTLKKDKKTFKKPLNGFDVALTCNICTKVFTDKIFLSIHRKKFHLTKSGRLKRNSKPVIKRNLPNIRPMNSNADKPVTNSRLRNVDKIDIIPKPVNCQKNDNAKKFNVRRIISSNAEQEKLSTTTTAQKTENAAIQLKPLAANTVQPKQLAANAELPKLLTTNAVQLISLVPNDTQLLLQNLNMGQVFSSKSEQDNSPNAEQENPPKVTQENPPKAAQDNPPKAAPKSEQDNPPKAAQDNPPKTAQDNPPKAAQQNPPKTAQQNPPNPKKRVDVKITGTGSARRTTKPISVSPATLLTPIKIVNVESCSSIARTSASTAANTVVRTTVIEPVSTPISNANSIEVFPPVVMNAIKTVNEETCTSDVSTATHSLTSTPADAAASMVHGKYYCQLSCDTCNVIFSNASELIAHEKKIHFPTNSSDNFPGDPFAKATPTKSHIHQLHQLVNKFPVQPKRDNDTEAQKTFTFDFESVLIPECTDDSDFPVIESPNSDGSVSEVIPLIGPHEERVFAKTAQNLRKRRSKPKNDTPATKRPKGIFDPVAYEQLCRQHNLVPSSKSNKRKSSSNTTKARLNTRK